MRRGVLLTSIVLPWLLLTVALLAGVRVTDAGELRFLVPPLPSLVAMLLLMMVLVQSHIVDPRRLMDAQRSALENLNGLMVLVALAAASAQVVSAVTPEAGLPLVLGVIFLFALFANTLAARPGRPHALRALFVAFFAAFTVKFIVLDALYAPDRSLGGRLLTGLLEGITLGTLDHVVWGASTGYVTFFALVLYFTALVLLPGGSPVRGSALLEHAIDRTSPLSARVPPGRPGRSVWRARRARAQSCPPRSGHTAGGSLRADADQTQTMCA